MIRFALAVLVCLSVSSLSVAADHVRGYVTHNGTYVAPHYRSHADGNFYNNWSTYGNVNPYTGSYGTRHYPSHTYGGYSVPSYSYPSYQSYYTPYQYGR